MSPFTPASLSQPILPGWSFGNVIVNETNSNAPDTEQRIVAQKSYGQQIGILLDALAVVAKDASLKTLAQTEAIKDLLQLETDVAKIKAEASEARVKRMEDDLEALRALPDPAAFNEAAERLGRYLSEHAPKPPA